MAKKLDPFVIRQKLLDAGVKNLHDFGYKFATEESLFKDMMCRAMFLSMLKDPVNITKHPAIEKERLALIAECEAANADDPELQESPKRKVAKK